METVKTTPMQGHTGDERCAGLGGKVGEEIWRDSAETPLSTPNHRPSSRPTPLLSAQVPLRIEARERVVSTQH